MKTNSCIRQNSAGRLVAAFVALLTAINFVTAQPLQLEVLASFNGTNGAWPYAVLSLGTDGNFYGSTYRGGSFDKGTVFKVTTNGVLTTLVSFAGTNGENPWAGLTLGGDGSFYGTTAQGGVFDQGTVFKVATTGVLTTLTSFDGTNGANPYAGLTQGNDGNFYGTTDSGGALPGGGGAGTVFRVTTNGALTTLVSFAGTNGSEPDAGLTLGPDGNFYGTTFLGGIFDGGTVFKVTTNGVLTSLASFAGTNGANPFASLTLGGDGNFYGMTEFYGTTLFGGNGSVFQVTTNGVLTTLVSFNFTNGAVPEAGLALGTDGNFYGTTSQGGDNDGGTVFQVTTNGTMTVLVEFTGSNGGSPIAGLTLCSDGNFYGTTLAGGTGGRGVIYRLRHGASIQSLGMTTNGFQLNTLNVGGSGWATLESSSDLVTWTPIQTNGTAAAQQFIDPAAPNRPRQFYRVRQQ